jgi:hypothetical protein
MHVAFAAGFSALRQLIQLHSIHSLEKTIMLATVLLILMLPGAIPNWRHSRNWGYYQGDCATLGNLQ